MAITHSAARYRFALAGRAPFRFIRRIHLGAATAPLAR